MRHSLSKGRGSKPTVFVLTLATIVAVMLVGRSAPKAVAGERDDHNSRVIPPNDEAFGQSYGEWAADWLQWMFAVPAVQNPQITNQNADAGQSGKVWFLAGDFVPGKYTRTATIPAGKALFFPIINEFWIGTPGDPAWDQPYTDPATGITYDSWEDYVIEFFLDPGVDAAKDLSCEIDGRPVHLGPAYRILSPSFMVELPPGNISDAVFGVHLDAGEYGPCLNEGYFLLLTPLPAGKHTIHFTGTSGTFQLDVTYHLTVRGREEQ